MMKKHYFAVFVLWICCAVWLVGCGNHDLFANEPESTASETATPEITLPETVPPEDALLREGRTAELVGISLGDDFDYDLFDGSNTYGYEHADPKYQGIKYHFDGKGHRFSGFSVDALYASGNQKETYFGIHFGKDRVDDMKDLFGEPDFYGEPEKPYFDKKRKERTAVWQFERATLTLWEVDRKICRLKYAAAEGVADGQTGKIGDGTGKGLQGNACRCATHLSVGRDGGERLSVLHGTERIRGCVRRR